MKQPKLNSLSINKTKTKKIRKIASSSNKIKITINIDRESLISLKEMAQTSGGSYQKLLNEILKKGITTHNDSEIRLQKLEKEVEKIRKKLAA